MNFISKNFNEFSRLSSINCTYQKPGVCPYCEINCDARNIMQYSYDYSSNNRIIFLILQCTACNKLFTATYNIKNNSSELWGVLPKDIQVFNDDNIEQISPRFIEMYNQALFAKENGHLNLAAIGYRTALEILVKDYAINELQKPSGEVVNKKLFDVISEYLPAHTLVSTADVIRILGNDHTHYERKYPKLDFDLLEQYMNIFISLVKTQLLIAHPPVSR